MLEYPFSDRTIILPKTSRMIFFFTCKKKTKNVNCYFLAPIPKEKALEFIILKQETSV